MPDTPDTLRTPAATAAQAILGTLARTGLKVLGTPLVTHGVMDAGTEAGLEPVLAQELAGAAMVGIASPWSIVRAWFARTRFAAAVEKLRAAEAGR